VRLRCGPLLLGWIAACATASSSGRTAGPQEPARDAGAQSLVPAGFGTLKQEDVAVQIDLTDVRARLVPLDESVIRLLAPDSYASLRDLLASRRSEIDRLARLRGLRERNVWYVAFYGLAPEARFTPTDLTITTSGREFRPLEIIPVSSGWGSQRLSARETQSALYVFDDGLDLAQPLTVTMGPARSTRWRDVLQTIERERALVRARARVRG
jgi:hypothetical protein